MYCSCGGEEMARSVWIVKTIKKALEWFDQASVDMLPLTIKSDTCRYCGRIKYVVKDESGGIVKRFG